jgi:DNA polymerase III subunit alpha
MDFLGLKTLSIIKETIENIKLSKGIILDIEAIPWNDGATYELFSQGETTAIFQFESDGMKKHLRDLKPNRFEDLVAMNALYRPGPMDYIPDYIARKHGRQKVEYDVPMMKKYLDETYGITVFQEQVMLLSRLLAHFTRGDSDTLRKAMGKKMFDTMTKLKVKFIKGCKANEQFVDECKQRQKDPETVIEKIWKDWEAFASYAFNKSHSVCYAHIAYQTGYLKAHYPAEFMAANLSRNLNNITDITKLMSECNRMKLKVLGPDVNESRIKFTVNREGNIRFGMAAVKGVGEGAARDIIKTRDKEGEFTDVFNFAERVNLQSVNKKTIEALAMAGAFDRLKNIKRSQFFAGEDPNDPVSFIEKLIRYGNKVRIEKQSMQQSLFGDYDTRSGVQKPALPEVEEWPKIILLEKEKNLIGVYLTAHPLDDYLFEIHHFCTPGVTIKEINNHMEQFKDRELTIAGMVTQTKEAVSRNGNPYSILTLSDYTDSYAFYLFKNNFVEFGKFCKTGLFLLVRGKIQKRYNQESLEFKIQQIELLSEVRKNHVKSLTIQISLDQINHSLIEEIDKQMKNKKGKTLLKFQITDKQNNRKICMFSRNTRIKADNSLIAFLENYPGMGYRIN